MNLTSLTPRFRLRTLLIFTFLCALALAIWPLIPSNREQIAMSLLESDSSIDIGFQRDTSQGLPSPDIRSPITLAFIDLYGPPDYPSPSATTFAPLADLWSLNSICIYNWGNRDISVPPFPFHRGPKYLFLCECKIDRDTLDSIAESLPNLEKLDLHANEHSQYSQGTFAKLLSSKRLTWLFLENVKLDSADLNAIANSRLKTLCLYYCTLPDQSFSFLAKSKIETFDYVPSFEQGDPPLTAFKDCVNLRRLDVDIAANGNRCLDELAVLKKAGTLKEITVRMPFNFRTRKRIEELRLDEPQDGLKITITK